MEFKLFTIEEEYSKDAKIKKHEIQQMLEWVNEHAYMPEVTKYMLIQCYQVSDYNLEKAKQLAETLYQFKNNAPELFTGRDFEPPKYNHSIFDTLYFCSIPKTTPEGYRILYSGLKDADASKYNHNTLITMCVKIIQMVIMEQGSCPGYIIIFDSYGMSFNHFRTFSIMMQKKFVQFIQEGIPWRMKAFHVINVHWIIEKMLMLTKPFMNKEFYDKIRLHSDIIEFYSAIPDKYIPKDIGGKLPYTRNELNELTRAKMKVFSKTVDEELQRRCRHQST